MDSADRTIDVPAFVVIGGGVDGSLYVRQLLRAVAAGRLRTERIIVVDRDPSCAARAFADPRVEIVEATWSDWLDRNVDALPPGSHLVPYHWAPHLLVEWLARSTRARGLATDREAPSPIGVPFERETTAGDRALSYATWTCPVTCIEPALCPHTRAPKDWSLAADLEAPRSGIDAALVFRCLHLVWGVGTIPVAQLLAARAEMREGAPRRRRYLVATSSHCHALAAVLEVTAPTTGRRSAASASSEGGGL